MGTSVKLSAGIGSFFRSSKYKFSSAPRTTIWLIQSGLNIRNMFFFDRSVLIRQRKQGLIQRFNLLFAESIGILLPCFPYHARQSIPVANKHIRVFNKEIL